jgi:hypothetical protein
MSKLKVQNKTNSNDKTESSKFGIWKFDIWIYSNKFVYDSEFVGE